MNFQIRRLYHEQQGQALYLVAALLIAMLGMAALSIDIGFALHGQRELQASADAAATAGAVDLSNNDTDSAAVAVAKSYSGVAGAQNAIHDLMNVTMSATYPLPRCLTTVVGLPCTVTSSGYNAMAVQETASAPTFFAKLWGINSIPLTAQSLSTVKFTGVPYNIAVIIDTTASMTGSDPSCKSKSLPSPTQEDCAKAGVQALLSELQPCAATSTQTPCAGQTPLQEVALFIFPGLSNTTYDQYEYDCQAQTLCASGARCTDPGAIATYSSTTNYSVVGLSNDYKTSDTATTLNGGSSELVDAVSWLDQSFCSTTQYGLQDPGGVETYYAGAISAAQNYLANDLPASRSTMQDAIILLSDGDANSSHISSSLANNQCSQAVTAAKNAAENGMFVYAIAYGAQNSGCSTDGGAYTPCSALKAIANSPGTYPDESKFYSDAAHNCISSEHGSDTNLSTIFSAIGQDFLNTMLIPFNTN
jgi:Flp pilus assembly protein TadG